MGQPTQRELQILLELRADLDRIENELSGDALPIQPGDLVQINPTADKVFGGMIMRVTRVLIDRVDGYLLRPHRAGTREAWHRRSHPEVTRLGRIVYTEAEWGFRGFWSPHDSDLLATDPRTEAFARSKVPKLDPVREMRAAARRRS